jgi:hypothetical protein
LKQVKKRNIEYNIFRSITIVNEGRHHAHMWCASKDDRIGGEEGLWLKPGEALAWTFHKTKSTQFWCTMDWFGRRYGWDVYVSNWEHNNIRDQRWKIRDDAIYDNSENKRMDIESNIVV